MAKEVLEGIIKTITFDADEKSNEAGIHMILQIGKKYVHVGDFMNDDSDNGKRISPKLMKDILKVGNRISVRCRGYGVDEYSVIGAYTILE